MKMIKKHLARTPLLLRVVFVYIVAFSAYATTSSGVNPGTPQSTATVASEHVRAFSSLPKDQQETGQPIRLRIDDLDLVKRILPGGYSAANDSWTLTDESVHYATMTALPNSKKGTTLLYGHNTWRVLEKTKALKQGDVATITTDSGETFSYRYKRSSSVLPGDTSVLTTPSRAPRLVIMTCEGWHNERRQLHYFELIRSTS